MQNQKFIQGSQIREQVRFRTPEQNAVRMPEQMTRLRFTQPVLNRPPTPSSKNVEQQTGKFII